MLWVGFVLGVWLSVVACGRHKNAYALSVSSKLASVAWLLGPNSLPIFMDRIVPPPAREATFVVEISPPKALS